VLDVSKTRQELQAYLLWLALLNPSMYKMDDPSLFVFDQARITPVVFEIISHRVVIVLLILFLRHLFAFALGILIRPRLCGVIHNIEAFMAGAVLSCVKGSVRAQALAGQLVRSTKGVLKLRLIPCVEKEQGR
jgi:hypothetical protein